MSKWKPISTIDTRGPVLLYGDWFGEINGRFDESPFAAVGEKLRGEQWTSPASDAYSTWCEPSHWMALPEPPK
jgi:hypothetical protein